MVLSLLLMASGVDAQKIDGRLTELVSQSVTRRAQGLSPLDAKGVNSELSVRFNADGSIKSLSAVATLKEGAQCPTEQLRQMGIQVRYVLGDMVALRIPADQLQRLEQVEEFSYVKADEIKQLANDEARKHTGVDQVNTDAVAQTMGLPQAYTGKGVVLGIIDAGIDYNHAAFCNADGTTRVMRVVEYDEDLDELIEYYPEDIKQLDTDYRETSHGSHTSAIAGGSELGNNMQGMAPETDLVLVGIGKRMSDANIVEGIRRVFDYADQVKKPAVVNISIGGIVGLHDGSDTMAKGIAQLTENGTKPGRAVVVSACNSASAWQSIVKTLPNTTDQLKTVLGASGFTKDYSSEYREMYYLYASDYQDFTATLAMIDLTSGKVVDMKDQLTNANGQKVNPADIKLTGYNVKTLKGTDAKVYFISFKRAKVYVDNVSYRFAIFVKAGHAGQTINMICSGDENKEPCFDAPVGTLFYDFPGNGWTKGNGDMACGTSVCNDAVISAGAYITRTQWNNYLDQACSYSKSALTGALPSVGEICDFSSYCVDDNGKPRPTLIAPGKGLISAANNYNTLYFKQSDPGVVSETIANVYKRSLCTNIPKFDRPNWYYVTQGTSMSAPVTSGVVALWMQANPQLTALQIMDIMKETCDNDEWTTDVSKIPSHNKVQAGFGKLNCLKGLKKILGTNAISVAGSDGDRHATPATMYSVDAPVYNTMGQQVDKSHKGLVIYKGKKYLQK